MNNSQPSKLFKLKKWLTLPEAARHLSVVCGEDISEADILRLALDGHLKISVNFVYGIHAKAAEWLFFNESPLFFKHESQDQTDFDGLLLQLSKFYGEKRGKVKSEKVYHIDGVWDLPLVGCERIVIGRKYQDLTDWPFEEHANGDGTFVEREGELFELQDSLGDKYGYKAAYWKECFKIRRLEGSKSKNTRKDNLLILRREKLEKLETPYYKWENHDQYYPTVALPEDSVLVVRTNALREFEQLISDIEPESNAATPTDAKPKAEVKKSDGHEERHARNREQILGAALSVLAKWPDECRTDRGDPLASKIARMVESKAELFWSDAKPPLKLETIEEHIRDWIKKTVGRK